MRESLEGCAEPGNDLGSACPIKPPFIGRFAIEIAGDRDFFSFRLDSYARVRIEVAAKEIGSGLDSYLCLYDAHGSSISCDDDSGYDTDSLLVLSLNPGIYFIEVRPYSGTGPYELRVKLEGS